MTAFIDWWYFRIAKNESNEEHDQFIEPKWPEEIAKIFNY